MAKTLVGTSSTWTRVAELDPRVAAHKVAVFGPTYFLFTQMARGGAYKLL